MKTLKEYAEEIEKEGMGCNCDLDNWQPELTTGHSHVCRIHKTAYRRYHSYTATHRMRKMPEPKQDEVNPYNKPADMTVEEEAIWKGLYRATDKVYETATKSGFHSNIHTGEKILRNFGEAVALMHSELSEALEANRKDLMDDKLPHRNGMEVEFADTIIRILDTGKAYGLDVPGAFIEKIRYNDDRLDHKVENRLKKGGKKY